MLRSLLFNILLFVKTGELVEEYALSQKAPKITFFSPFLENGNI
jgi:hypothetical protein